MAYPSPSDFTAAEPDAFDPPAWWTYTRDDGSQNVCAATGAAVVQQIRRAAGADASSTWDDTLQGTLVTRARSIASAQQGANWGPLIAALQNDADTRSVSDTSLRFGIWVGFYQSEGLRLDAVGIPGGTTPPAWGRPLPEGPGGGSVVCFDPSRDPNPGVLSDAQLSDAVGQSTSGVRLHPGESLPGPASPVPPGPSGISNLTLLGIGVAAIAAVGVVVAMNAQASRRSSARRRRP